MFIKHLQNNLSYFIVGNTQNIIFKDHAIRIFKTCSSNITLLQKVLQIPKINFS